MPFHLKMDQKHDILLGHGKLTFEVSNSLCISKLAKRN